MQLRGVFRAGFGRFLVVLVGCLFLASGDLASQEITFSSVTLDTPNPQAGAQFGLALAGVGDLNADAVPDLLVGALAQLNRGHSFQAAQKLGDFTDQVNAYINVGILSPAQGQLLLDAANNVINEIIG